MYDPTMVVEFERKDKNQKLIHLELSVPQDEKAVIEEAAKWISDNRTRLFLRRSISFTESYEAEWIKKCNTDEGNYHWRIYADGVHVGGCGLHGISYEDGNAELGLMIGNPDYWGKGITQVAEIAMTEYAFNNIVVGGLHKIIACVFTASDGTGNDASRGAIQKIGYREIGVYREDKWLQGRWYDTWHCELLASQDESLRDHHARSLPRL